MNEYIVRDEAMIFIFSVFYISLTSAGKNWNRNSGNFVALPGAGDILYGNRRNFCHNRLHNFKVREEGKKYCL